MSRTAVPSLNQSPGLTASDVHHLLESMIRHPTELDVGAHQPLLESHLVKGYIAILEEHGFLAGIRHVCISYASFDGALMTHLACFTGIECLEFGVNDISGPLDLVNVPAQKVILIENDFLVPNRGGDYLRLSPKTNCIELFGRNVPHRELQRLGEKYPLLDIHRKRR